MINGSSFKVKQLVTERQAHGLSPEELQFQHPQLSLARIYSALAYYEDHRDEIDRHIREAEARAEALKGQLDSPDLKALISSRTKR